MIMSAPYRIVGAIATCLPTGANRSGRANLLDLA